MWYFTPLGFYSVVKNLEGNTDTVLVRTRDRSHLDKLQLAFPRELLLSPVIETADRDYPYRLIVPRQDWVAVARQMAEKIDYGNFKDEAGIVSEMNAAGDRYLDVLHRIWTLLYERYQDARPKPKEPARKKGATK